MRVSRTQPNLHEIPNEKRPKNRKALGPIPRGALYTPLHRPTSVLRLFLSERVTHADGVSGCAVAGGDERRRQGRRGDCEAAIRVAVVAHSCEQAVDHSALGQLVDVAETQLRGIGLDLVAGAEACIADTELTRLSDGGRRAQGIRIDTAPGATFGRNQHHRLHESEVVRSAQVDRFVGHFLDSSATLQLCIAQRDVERVRLISHACGDEIASAVVRLAASALAEAVLHLAVEATHLGRQIRDDIACALGVATLLRASGDRCVAEHVVSAVASHSNVAERVKGLDVQIGRELVPAKSNLAKPANQANSGATVKAKCCTAVVNGNAAFKPEAGLETSAEVFQSTKTQTAARLFTTGESRDARAVAGQSCHRCVDNTEESGAALRKRPCSGRENRKGDERVFHVVYCCAVELDRVPMRPTSQGLGGTTTQVGLTQLIRPTQCDKTRTKTPLASFAPWIKII